MHTDLKIFRFISLEKSDFYKVINLLIAVYPINQPLRSDRIWHKVNF